MTVTITIKEGSNAAGQKIKLVAIATGGSVEIEIRTSYPGGNGYQNCRLFSGIDAALAKFNAETTVSSVSFPSGGGPYLLRNKPGE